MVFDKMLEGIGESYVKLGCGPAYSVACARPSLGLVARDVRRSVCIGGRWNRFQSQRKSELKNAEPHSSTGDSATGVALSSSLAVDTGTSVDHTEDEHVAELNDVFEAAGAFGPCMADIADDHDDQMVRRTIAGDQEAFEVLVRRHSPRVFNIIGSFFRRRDLVEDIAQDVFIKSYTSLASYTLGRSFEAWLARIAVNCCYDQLRAQRRRGEQLSPQESGLESDWLDLQMLETAISRHASEERQREAADVANRLLSKLMPEDRVVLILMDRDGYSVKEISDMTGWGSSKVKVRAFRARRTLRTAMKRLMTSAERKHAREQAKAK
jgi:RNA polymerase sigma-70 factor, ECF subfamily